MAKSTGLSAPGSFIAGLRRASAHPGAATAGSGGGRRGRARHSLDVLLAYSKLTGANSWLALF